MLLGYENAIYLSKADYILDESKIICRCKYS